MKKLNYGNEEIKDEFILDDDKNFYHVCKYSNREIKNIISKEDVISLLKKNIDYRAISIYGTYRLTSFRAKILCDYFK